MDEKTLEKLRLVQAALLRLEVRGRENLSLLLGCIQALEQLTDLKGGDAA